MQEEDQPEQLSNTHRSKDRMERQDAACSAIAEKLLIVNLTGNKRIRDNDVLMELLTNASLN